MKEALAFVFPAWYYFAAGMVDGARLSLIWHESGILVRIIWCKWEALKGRMKVAIASRFYTNQNIYKVVWGQCVCAA